jgi:hypothetical protein
MQMGHGGESTDMRPRRLLGTLERALLGTAMSAVLYVVERRLSQRMKTQREAEHATGNRREDGRRRTL